MCCYNSRKIVCFVILALLAAAWPIRAGETARGHELRQHLDGIIRFEGIEDARVTLSDVLDQLGKRYNLSFDIHEEAFKQDDIKEVGKFEIVGMSGPIPAMNTSLGTVLHRILRRVSPSATYLIRGDTIEVTTTEAIRKEFFADRPTMPGPLPPLASGAFEKVPLEHALKELSRYGNIVLDARSVKEGQMPVSADVANVPLDSLVRMLADMAGLKVVSLDNSLYVTSKESAEALQKEQDKQKREREQEEKAKKEEEKPKPAAPKPAKETDKKVL